MISHRPCAQIQNDLSKKTPGCSDAPQNFEAVIKTTERHSKFIELSLNMNLLKFCKPIDQGFRRAGVPEMAQRLPKSHEHRVCRACIVAFNRLRKRTQSTRSQVFWCHSREVKFKYSIGRGQHECVIPVFLGLLARRERPVQMHSTVSSKIVLLAVMKEKCKKFLRSRAGQKTQSAVFLTSQWEH